MQQGMIYRMHSPVYVLQHGRGNRSTAAAAMLMPCATMTSFTWATSIRTQIISYACKLHEKGIVGNEGVRHGHTLDNYNATISKPATPSKQIFLF